MEESLNLFIVIKTIQICKKNDKDDLENNLFLTKKY